jgi:uncharacterized protein
LEGLHSYQRREVSAGFSCEVLDPGPLQIAEQALNLVGRSPVGSALLLEHAHDDPGSLQEVYRYLFEYHRQMDVSDLIRRTRLDARLSQRDLAQRAGTSQSALARYEGGHARPSLTTLERILRAAGKTLRLEVDDADADPPKHPVQRRLESRLEPVRAILVEHGVTAVSVFGSTARGEDAETSDLDLLVELPGATYVKLASLQTDLEEALGVPVDVTVQELLDDDARRRVSTKAIPL